MAKYVEYRVPMPLTMEKYYLGSRYASAKIKLQETGDNKGFIHMLTGKTEHPELEHCDVSHYILNLSDQGPDYLPTPQSVPYNEIHISSYRNFPKTYTEIWEPILMKQYFYIISKTTVIPDKGESENALNLQEDELAYRRIDTIDIRNDRLSAYDERLDEDPATRELTVRSNTLLPENWLQTESTYVCSYQYHEILYRHWSIQNFVERGIEAALRRIFQVFHRRMYCWIDEWYEMTEDAVKQFEDAANEQLNSKMRESEFTGMIFK